MARFALLTLTMVGLLWVGVGQVQAGPFGPGKIIGGPPKFPPPLGNLTPPPPLPPGISDAFIVFDPLGNVFAMSQVADAVENSTQIIYLQGVAIDPTQFGNPTVLTEPGVNPLQGYSDIFGIATGGPDGMDLAFSSNDDNSLVNFGQFPRTFPEGNGVFDATMYLSPQLQAQGFTAIFESSSGDSVPEPGTLTLLALGAAGLGVYGWRQRKRAA